METRGMHPIDGRFYRAPDKQRWRGRIDGEDDSHLRWHQHIRPLDLLQPPAVLNGRPLVLLGFACDEGVSRNNGRTGAADGPGAVRKALCNLPVVHPGQAIYDAGDIHCPNGELENAQHQVALAVTRLLHTGALPVLLGGGHEITYGHFCGIRDFLIKDTGKRIGIVNFDAHFDNRQPQACGASSGTGFWQIAQDCNQCDAPFYYLALGIQNMSNTRHLFDTAHQTGTRYVLAHHFDAYSNYDLLAMVRKFAADVDTLYLTIDLDVFAAPYAPGVSAPAYQGIVPDRRFFDCLEWLVDCGKIASFDIAELNPAVDIDGRTARLAASLIFRIAERLAEKQF